MMHALSSVTYLPNVTHQAPRAGPAAVRAVRKSADIHPQTDSSQPYSRANRDPGDKVRSRIVRRIIGVHNDQMRDWTRQARWRAGTP